MARKLNVGLIGVGVIGVNQLKSFQACDDAEVVAVADIKRGVAKSVGKEYDVSHVFTDYQELLDVKGLDAVSVCTPPFAHAEPTCAAARKGKHVLCEKPMAMNVREAEEILVDSKWFLDSSKAGGGCLMDIGCYDIDFMLYVLDNPEPVSVAATTFRGVGEPAPAGVVHDVEDHASVFVRFEGELVVCFEQSFAANMANADSIMVFGTKAGMSADPLTLYAEQDGQQVKIVPDIPQQQRGALPQPLIADFVVACLEDREPKTPGEEGLAVTRIIQAAYASARQGREVSIDEAASA
jgi:predicted dehydrogenase